MNPTAADNGATAADQPNGNGGKHGSLTLYIVVAIVVAVVLALVFPRLAMAFDVGGQIFLRLLQMVVVPLVMASVMSGILGLGDVRKLGRPGGAAILYYLTTTILAVVTGLAVVNVVNPGIGVDPALVEDARKEGAREIKKATASRAAETEVVTWDSEETTEKSDDGQSDIIPVGNRERRHILLKFKQQGTATSPASAQVHWSEDGEQWRALRWKSLQDADRFQAGAEPGNYQASTAIPMRAGAIRVDYTAQRGGEQSTLTATIVPGPPSIVDIFKNLLLMLFTDNLLRSMVEMNLLPLIIFSIVFAGMLTTMGHRSEIVANFVISVNDALMSFILLLMKVAPLGIFCLVAARFGKAQADGRFFELLNIQLFYIVSVLVGLGIHAFVTLPLLFYVFVRRNPYRFMTQMSQALLTAFSTASSTATLPVTMECAETKAGVSKRSTEFVLPLGATINMDGTALYEAAAAIFIAQALPGFDLTATAQLTIALTATLAAIGAAGIPEAGLVTMLIVLNAVGLPLELIGLIIPVDWLLDRFRTAVNAFGDSVGAAIVDGTFET